MLDSARLDELLAGTREALHVHDPAVHAEYTRVVHVLRACLTRHGPCRQYRPSESWYDDRVRARAGVFARRDRRRRDEAIIWGAVLLIVGVPMFYWMRASRSRGLREPALVHCGGEGASSGSAQTRARRLRTTPRSRTNGNRELTSAPDFERATHGTRHSGATGRDRRGRRLAAAATDRPTRSTCGMRRSSRPTDQSSHMGKPSAAVSRLRRCGIPRGEIRRRRDRAAGQIEGRRRLARRAVIVGRGYRTNDEGIALFRSLLGARSMS